VAGRSRSYLGYLHCVSAVILAKQVHRIEQEPKSHATESEHRAYATGVFLTSVAFMEGLINEILADAHDNTDTVPTELNAALQKVNREDGCLRKYQNSLSKAGKEPFDREADPYESVAALIQLRNSLVHYIPESQSGQYRSKARSTPKPPLRS
jgi:hypothetical protein